MKKIIAILIASFVMASASFALDLELGARGVFGRNLDGSLKDTWENVKNDKTVDIGGGAYFNFALFGGLGIQLEGNYITSKYTFVDNEKNQRVDYELHTLDLAPMAWLNLDLWKFTVGFGVGPNFSIPLATFSDIKNATKQDFVVGLIAGADFKFYVTDHFGIVLSGRFVTEWNKKDIPFTVNEFETGATYPKIEFHRKTIYGGLGVELKLL